MTRDLDTLLRDAVATTPPDTDAVLSRARTIRRRRTATRVVGALAVLGVVAAGIVGLLDDEPRAPIVANDPAEVEGALVPVLPATPADATATLLQVDVPRSAFPDPATLPDDVGRGPLLAVGPDGTTVLGSGRDQLTIHWPHHAPVRTELPGAVRATAVLADGTVLVGLGSDSDHEPLDRVATLEADGGGGAVADVRELADPMAREPAPTNGGTIVVQDPDRVRFATADGVGRWRAVEVWTGREGVVTDRAVEDVRPAESSRWWWSNDTGVGDGRRVARGDGTVLEVEVPVDSMSASRGENDVVAGRMVGTIAEVGTSSIDHHVGVVIGPGDGVAAVVPVARAPSHPLSQFAVSVDGALWLGTGQQAARIVPAGGLPDEPRAEVVRPVPPPPAELPAAPERAAREAVGVAVAPPGVTVAGPTEPIERDLVARLGAAWCGDPLAVGTDGTLVAFSRREGGGCARVLRVAPPDDGPVSEVHARQLWRRHGARTQVAVDDTGNLWALADRWWSGARFPDLVVRRPGDPGFTSVGHLPLDDLLEADATSVVLHAHGDEVALLAHVTDGAGRRVLGHRVVVARDGEVLTADERAATVGSVAGVSPATTMSWSGTYWALEDGLGESVLEQPAAVSGPFVGMREPGRVAFPPSRTSGNPGDPGLDGGVVVVERVDDDEDDAVLLVGDQHGTTAAVRVAAPRVAPLVAADGSVWGVLSESPLDDDRRFVQLLTADWRAAG